MASAPVIAPAQSVLGFPQWAIFSLQFAATGVPTSWSISGAPPGMFWDSVAGNLSGAAVVAGLYSFYVIATNGTGDSAPVLFSIRIWASAASAENVTEINIDLVTGEVKIPGWATAMADLLKGDVSDPSDPQPDSLMEAKVGDVKLFDITFYKNGVLAVPPTITELDLTLKEFVSELVLLEQSAFNVVTNGDITAFRLAVTFDAAALRTALSNYGATYTDRFLALAEFHWVSTNDLLPTTGPDNLVNTSQSFSIQMPYTMTPAS